MLREIDKNLWVSEQPFKYWGLEVGTRMTVIRLKNGEVTVISPIEVNEKIIEQINQLGQVSLIIAPNLYHHLFVAKFTEIYPQAQLWVAPGLEKKRPDLTINKIFIENEIFIKDEIEYLIVKGFETLDINESSPLNEVVFFHRATQTLILTDTAFYFDESFPLKTQVLTRLIQAYKQLRPSLLEKIATVNKEPVKQSIEKILKWDFKRVIMAHGNIIENEGKSKLKEGYEWFLGKIFKKLF